MQSKLEATSQMIKYKDEHLYYQRELLEKQDTRSALNEIKTLITNQSSNPSNFGNVPPPQTGSNFQFMPPKK